jgi:hypothetical protein
MSKRKRSKLFDVSATSIGPMRTIWMHSSKRSICGSPLLVPLKARKEPPMRPNPRGRGNEVMMRMRMRMRIPRRTGLDSTKYVRNTLTTNTLR